jgi:hypothetical protein
LRLEFFEDGLDDGPLILLYGGTTNEVARLRGALRDVAKEIGRRFRTSDLSFVQPIETCSLEFVSADTDVGVIGSLPFRRFEWRLRPESWRHVGYLLEPFCEEQEGSRFQYLNPADGPGVIYSTSRAW